MSSPLQEFYSYPEIAMLCRRSVATIATLVSRNKIPHISHAKGAFRAQRIALVPLEGVQRIRALTMRDPTVKYGSK